MAVTIEAPDSFTGSMQRVLILPLILAGLIGSAAGLAGQVRIAGRVIEDETLTPIAGAKVVVSRAGGRSLGQVHTNDRGVFSFTVPRQGGYVFEASRIGYEEAETPILWTDGYEDYQVEIRLAPDAVLLAPIEVLARSREGESPVVESFWDRRETGLGHYFTRAEIEAIKPSRVTDLLRRVPGVQLRGGGAGLRQTVYMSRGTVSCPAQIFVDGMLWSRPTSMNPADASEFTVDDAVHPTSVLGIEVYRGLSAIPAEFLTPESSRCGVIAIWTRREGPPSAGG